MKTLIFQTLKQLSLTPESPSSPLSIAVASWKMDFSRLLLSYNGNVNKMTSDGNTLLISAIHNQTPKKFVDLLLEYGSQPNAKNKEGRTALFNATEVGRVDIVKSLLEHGADANLPGPKHVLWPSISHSQCLQLLLSHGADYKKCPGIMELAASINSVESVRILLKAGVDPNTKNDGTYTTLCTAIRDNRTELLQLPLSNGADPNIMESEYPCFKCITHNKLHFLPLLVAAGANLHSPRGILETAVRINNFEALNWLLDHGVNPNDQTPRGMSPLTTAIRENHIEMVELLLLRGADPHMRGEGWPICMAVHNPPILKRILRAVSRPQEYNGVLELAVSANQLESVKILLAAGVSVEDKNCGVFTPLTTELGQNLKPIVAYLLTDGKADVNAPGEHLPIVKALTAYRDEDTEILELLLQHGADPNNIYQGWNAFMQAVLNGDIYSLKLLSQKAGVDLDIEDDQGNKVVEMVVLNGRDEAVQKL
jgi:ankyrin repeat protein